MTTRPNPNDNVPTATPITRPLPIGRFGCGYCGKQSEDFELHSMLYGMLSDFYHEHHANRTWQHCHEWAARIEAAVFERVLQMPA